MAIVPQIPYDKIKKIDKYAKSLGLTIYRLDCDFKFNDKTYILSDTAINKPTQQYIKSLK